MDGRNIKAIAVYHMQVQKETSHYIMDPQLNEALNEMWRVIRQQTRRVDTRPCAVFVRELKVAKASVLHGSTIDDVFKNGYIMDCVLCHKYKIARSKDGSVAIASTGPRCLRLTQKGSDVHAELHEVEQ